MKYLELIIVFLLLIPYEILSQSRTISVEIFVETEDTYREIIVNLEAISTVWEADHQSDPIFFI